MTLFEHTKIIEANSQLMEINVVQTVKEYFNSLPGLVVQTRRHLFSNDLNILENFSRRLEDSLSIVNTLKTRFKQTQASVELLLNIKQLIRELHRLFSSIEGTLLDYSHEDDNIERCFMSETKGRNGRPKVEVSKEIIERLFEIHRSW